MGRQLYIFLILIFAFGISSDLKARILPPPCTVSPITGPSNVCYGGSITLADVSTGGTWSSSAASVATIGSSSGHVTPTGAGVTTITYTLSPGCAATTTVTVGVAPDPITDPSTICGVGSGGTFTDPTPGGTWSSSDTSVITIGSASGIAAAVGIGPTTIIYIVGGCSTTTTLNVNLSLPPIGVPSTPLCPGDMMTLTVTLGGGTYSSSNPAVAAVSVTGVVTGVSGGPAIITYSYTSACFVTAPVSINPAPAPIGGGVQICLGSTLTLTDASPGGFWSSTNNAIATITSAGLVNGISSGYDTIIYTFPATGCTTLLGFTVIQLPAISGWDSICAWGDTTVLTDAYPGGLYTSSLVTVDNLGAGTAIMNGNAPGSATVTYTIPAGCSVTKTVSVNPLPDNIAGILRVCSGFTSNLSDLTPGGTWSSGNTAIATISGTGLVSGVALGTVEVYYTLSTGCKTDTAISVTVPPSVIGGPGTICAGTTAILTDSVAGGTWSSSYPPYATINSLTGSVTGYEASAVTITYSLTGSCTTTKSITVNPLPAIFITDGGGNYCAGGAGVHVYLTGSQTGINYQLYTGTTAVDTAMHGTGAVLDFGLQTGTGIYTVIATNTATGCTSEMSGTAMVITDPLPTIFPLTGGGGFCAGSAGVHIGLAGSAVGVNYQLYSGSIASGAPVPGTGSSLDFGLFNTTGTYTVIAANSTTGCTNIMSGSAVTTIASPVTPSVSISSSWGDTVCSGVAVLYSAAPVNGGTIPIYQWKVNGINVGADAPTFDYVPSNGDDVTVTLTSDATCANPDTADDSIIMTVNPSLVPIVSLIATPGISIVHGQSVTFTATATSAGPLPSYQWLVNGIPVAGDTVATFTSSSLGNDDTVTCVVISSGACGGLTGSNSLIMNVNTTGVTSVSTSKSDISILPNPNKGDFIITGTLSQSAAIDEDAAVSITDLLGQIIYKGSIKLINGKINEPVSLSNGTTNGVYLLNLQSSNNNWVFHVVIER